MVMGKIIMTKYVGNNFLGKNPLQVLVGLGCVLRHAGVLVVCQFSLGGRTGVLVAVWWCVRRCPVMSWVFFWCFGRVPVVSWWY